MSDNGLLNGEHGMVDKRTMHEPSIRIPMVVRYPGLMAPGKPRVILPYLGGFDVYEKKCAEVAENDYEGFVTA